MLQCVDCYSVGEGIVSVVPGDSSTSPLNPILRQLKHMIPCELSVFLWIVCSKKLKACLEWTRLALLCILIFLNSCHMSKWINYCTFLYFL